MNSVRLVLAIVGLVLCQSVFAEQKIGVFDMRAAILASDSAREFDKKMVEQFKPQEMQVRAVGEEGQKLEQRLKNDRDVMSDNELKKLTGELKAKAQEYKYLRQKLDSELAEAQQEYLAQSTPKIEKAVQAVVESEGLDLLLVRQSVFFAKPALDYTEMVVEKLNALGK